MTTYNTGNPIGSKDPRDLYDNAENFDTAVNSNNDTFVDRLGKERPTVKGGIDPSGLVQTAVNAKNEALAARDAAFVNADVYSSTTEGTSAVSVGDQFLVVSTSGREVIRYRKHPNGGAEEVARFPASKYTFEQSRKNSYVLLGRITKAEFRSNTKEWVISHTRLRIMQGSGRGFVSVDAASDVVIPNNGCYYIDLEGVPVNSTILGQVASGWASASYGTGAFVDDLKYPLFAFSSLSGAVPGGHLFQNGMPSQSNGGAQSKITVEKTDDNMYFYIQGTGNNSIRFRLIKHNNPDYDPNNLYSRRQLWRMTEMSEVDSNHIVVREDFVTNGENELAISAPGGWNDAVGGFHGDELFDASKTFFIADGSFFPENAVFSGDFEEIRFVQESDIYEGKPDGVIFARHTKDYRFNENGLFLSQKLEFTKTITVRNIMIGMLCMRRRLNGATGEQITTTAIYPNNEIVDVSVAESFPNLSRPVEQGGTMTLTGNVGISAQIIAKRFNFNNYEVRVSNATTYNKIYFHALPYSSTEVLSTTIDAGTVFESDLQYKVNTAN